MNSVLYSNVQDIPDERRGHVKVLSQEQNQEQHHKRKVKQLLDLKNDVMKL